MGSNTFSGTRPKPRPTWRANLSRTDARVWVCFFALLAVCSSAAGQVHRIRATAVACDRGQCVLVPRQGSAVAIGRFNPTFELLLTAAHVVDGKLQTLEIQIGDSVFPAEVRAIDKRLDLAVVGIRSKTPLRPACLAKQKPGDGTPAMAAGFPDGSTTVASPTGTVLAFNNPNVVRYGITTRPGMSGGALFDQDGNLLGIISARGICRPITNAFLPTDDGTGFAIAAPACRRFLQTTLGGIPDCRRPRPTPPKPPATEGETMPPPPSKVDTTKAELAILRTELAELQAELAELKKRPADNAELTERIVIVEGPPGRDGKDGRDGQDANPEDLVALSSAINSSLDFRERELTELANTTKRKMEELRVALTAAESRTADRLDDLVDEVSGLALDLEKLQARVGDNANAASLADQAVREKVRALEGENAKLKEAILAFEQWRKTYRTTVQILDPSGRVIKSESFGLNEPIQLQLKPTDKTASSTPERIGF